VEARKLRVCVVGAGVSGLTALKEVLEEGHSAVCLERENLPGGVFTTGVAYSPMQLTVSQYFMAYSSFPPPLEEERRHWQRQEYVDYLVLVEFEPGHVPCLTFLSMEEELSRILGRKVDLNTPGFLSPYFRDQVLAEAEVQYAQA
jgi:glycine/D-amino acid oxidase-like deaminating enzyme